MTVRQLCCLFPPMSDGNYKVAIPMSGEMSSPNSPALLTRPGSSWGLIWRTPGPQQKTCVSNRPDCVSANVMVADMNRNIIYMNDAVINTLRNAQTISRKDLPNFDVDKLQGRHYRRLPQAPGTPGQNTGNAERHLQRQYSGGRSTYGFGRQPHY